MALGLAFFRFQDKKRPKPLHSQLQLEGSGYTWILTRAFPPGWLNNNHRSDRNGFLIGGNVWQSRMKLDIEVIYRPITLD